MNTAKLRRALALLLCLALAAAPCLAEAAEPEVVDAPVSEEEAFALVAEEEILSADAMLAAEEAEEPPAEADAPAQDPDPIGFFQTVFIGTDTWQDLGVAHIDGFTGPFAQV